VAQELAKQERERKERLAAVNGLLGPSSLLLGGGAIGGGGGAHNARPLDSMVGRLRVGAGAGAGPSGHRRYDHPGRAHQALFVAPGVTAPPPKPKR
jgi:hypothetical protein